MKTEKSDLSELLQPSIINLTSQLKRTGKLVQETHEAYVKALEKRILLLDRITELQYVINIARAGDHETAQKMLDLYLNVNKE